MTNVNTRVVHIPEERDMARLLNVAKYGAKRDNVTVVIERRTLDGAAPTPLFTVSPTGHVRDLVANPFRPLPVAAKAKPQATVRKAPVLELRVSIKDRLRATVNDNRNVEATRGLAHFSMLGAEAERMLHTPKAA